MHSHVLRTCFGFYLALAYAINGRLHPWIIGPAVTSLTVAGFSLLFARRIVLGDSKSNPRFSRYVICYILAALFFIIAFIFINASSAAGVNESLARYGVWMYRYGSLTWDGLVYEVVRNAIAFAAFAIAHVIAMSTTYWLCGPKQ